MHEKDSILVFMILLLVVCVPFVYICIVLAPEPFYRVNGDPVLEVAQITGLTTVNVTPVQWSYQGATGGNTYILEDETGNTLTLQTQTFESENSRNAAVQTFNAQTVGKGKPTGTLMIIGHLLIYLPLDQHGIIPRIASELKKFQKGL